MILKDKNFVKKVKLRYTTKTFIEKAISVHGKTYKYNKVKYKGSKTKVIIICRKHKEFTQEPRLHLSGHGCKFCADDMNTVRQSKPFSYYKERSIAKYGNKFTYDEKSYVYDKSTKRAFVDITCPEHGMTRQRMDQHLDKVSAGCKYCSFIKGKIWRVVPKDVFIKRALIIHRGLYNYDDVVFINMQEPAKNIKCLKHGYFSQQPTQHLRGNGCPICSSSQGELRIRHFLNYNNVEFKREYCIPGFRYRYDFYIPGLNVLIEYDGAQHFVPIKFFGGPNNLEKIKERDEIKNFIAKDRGYTLIRINYKSIDIIEKELMKILNSRIIYKRDNNLFRSFLKFARYFELSGDATPSEYKKYLFKFICPS